MKRLFLIYVSLVISAACFSQTVKWYTIEEALELNKKEPRKLIVDVYTDWCGWCKVMEKNTYNNEIIAEYINKNFYNVKLNAEQKEDIKFGDRIFKFVPQGSRGYHELAAAFLDGKMGYPSVVFFDEKIRRLHYFQGYIKAKQFDEIVKYIGGDYFKNVSWEEFLASYESNITE
jgi:thioredoxin-related protein